MRKPTEGSFSHRAPIITVTSQAFMLCDHILCRSENTALRHFRIIWAKCFLDIKSVPTHTFPTYTTYTGHLENHCSRKVSFCFHLFAFVSVLSFPFVRNLRSSNTAKFTQIEGNGNETINWNCGQYPGAGFSPSASSSSTTTVTHYPTGWTQSWKSWKKWFQKENRPPMFTFFLPRLSWQVKRPIKISVKIIYYQQYFNIDYKSIFQYEKLVFHFQTTMSTKQNIGISFRQALKDQILFHLPIFIRSACSLMYFTFSV